jgi:2Fe-2S ferredoxin
LVTLGAVIPAQAGIQQEPRRGDMSLCFCATARKGLDSRLRGNDGLEIGRHVGVRGVRAMQRIRFTSRGGWRISTVDAPNGLSVLEVAHKHGIDLEGACEGSLACSTCHVIIDPSWFEVLKDPTEDEEDMLDLAFGLTKTSRLGCQITMSEELDGLVVSGRRGRATC